MARNQDFTLNIKALFDTSDVKNKVNNLQDAFKNIKLPDNLQKSFDKTIADLVKSVNDFESKAGKGIQSKTDATGITKAIDNVIKDFTKVEDIIAKIQSEINSSTDLSKIIKLDNGAIQKIQQLKNDIKDLRQQIADITTSKLDDVNSKLNDIKSKGAKAGAQKAIELFNNGEIEEAIKLLDQVKQKQEQIKNGNYNDKAKATAESNINALNSLLTTFKNAQSEVSTLTDQVNDKTRQLGEIAQQSYKQAIDKVNQETTALNQNGEAARNNRDAIVDMANGQAQFNSEVDQLKSRVQYFFGLNNAIQLVKRTMREAYNTIKELDAAMTETAVVTDFSVGDMWAQLPDYTKRANELGVSTKAAYEAATLYYQQGLKTNEVMAMSNETLKMARIAGLDAAVATDRMTNAIRGFNMEINTTNAQRIDDVYSKLAAISASNVDEISTAMTKVASLAHSANMEFETTAAFLAQIIETTRESAETAGTALKTVVARFSEVKKLVSEGELKGSDEEGELIDVNKVSSALRTAGIDLNKYFLGEVGLDDIFMELASKWDSLTNLQQRYIATQAAGSRQQSRFIALMSDYARTQELVGEAYNANGAAAEQFGKTQESLESKLARLKNAWNEFAMGVLNSDLVKVGVDLLTNILNGINALTSGFGALDKGVGGVINSISKLILLFGSLGVGKTLLSGLATSVSNIGLTAAGKAPLDVARAMATTAVGANATGTLAGLAGRGKGGALLAGFLNPFAGIGNIAKAGWGGLQQLGAKSVAGYGGIFGKAGAKLFGSGLLTGVGETASFGLAGLTSLTTALGAVTVAAGAAYAVIKRLYDLSPAGQVKIAQKYADALQSVADNAKGQLKEYQSVQDEYKKLSEQVNNSTNVAERSTAIKDRNEYITSLLEQNAAYAEYLSTTFENGEILLTLDEDKLAAAVDKIAEGAVKASAYSSMANAVTAGQQADLYRSELKGVNLVAGTRSVRPRGEDEAIDVALSNEEIAKYTRYQSAAEESDAQMRAYVKSAAAELINTDLVSDEVASIMADLISEGFDADKISNSVQAQQRKNWWSGEATTTALKAKYESIFGIGSSEDIEKAEQARAVAFAEVMEETTEQQIDQLEKYLTGNNHELYEAILSAAAGTGLINEINLSDFTLDGDVTDLFTALGIHDTQLVDLAEATGRTVDSLMDQIIAQAKLTKEVQKVNKSKIYEKLLRSGNTIDQTIQNYIQSLTPDQAQQISDIITQSEQFLTPESYQGLINELVTNIPQLVQSDELNQIQDFFNNFNLDDPINAFIKLKEAEKEAVPDGLFSNFLKEIKEANKAIFNSGNLFQSFIQSNEYEELTEEVHKFVEENNKLTSDKVIELADKSKSLKTILDDTEVTARGLAEALTLLDAGNIPIEGFTERVLDALSSMEGFDFMLEDIANTIKNFDSGRDFGEGSDFLNTQADTLLELINGYEFGNEQTRNIYDLFFGPDAYNQFMSDWGTTGVEEYSELLKAKVNQFQDWVANNSYGFMEAFTNNTALGISKNGEFDFKWDSKGRTTEELIKEVQKQAQISHEAAEMIIEGFAAQSYDFASELKQNDYTQFLEEFAKTASQTRTITEQELTVLGAAFDKTSDQIYADLEKIQNKKGIQIPIKVNWQDKEGNLLTGDALINSFKESLGNIDLSQYVQSVINSSTGNINADALLSNLQSDGLNPDQAAEIADKIASDIDGAMLEKTISVPKLAEDGITITSENIAIAADSLDGLTTAADVALEAAQYELVANKLAESNLSGFENLFNTTMDRIAAHLTVQLGAACTMVDASGVATAITNAGDIAAGKIQSIIASTPFQGTVYLQTVVSGTGSGALGGIVSSYASGNNIPEIQPGWALTGEEAPEIVWNKKRGYAYITGANGPEFRVLLPGDRVFNAQETSRILKNSSFAKGGVFGSYATGGYNRQRIQDYYSKKYGGSGGSGGSSSGEKEPTKEEWRSDFDWLYNLMEDIAELQREQNKLQEEQNKILELANKNDTGKDLYENLVKQMANLLTQKTYQSSVASHRRQEMQEFMAANAGYNQYFRFNDKDQTLEINWDAINNIGDKETYEKVKDLVSEAEAIQKKMDESDDAVRDIEAQIRQLENIWREQFIDFEKRVLDALVKSYQRIIDNYSDLNDTVTRTNNDILTALQEEVALERQIRDNTKAEEAISDAEARLAFLRRDTTGGNQVQILAAQKQLDEQRQEYENSLVDQSISRLQEDNEKAAEQREKQIELMQAQLNYAVENGEFNSDVYNLISDALDANGELLTNSDLFDLLQREESWAAMSATSKEVWEDELNNTFKEVSAYLLKEQGEADGSYLQAVASEINDGVWASANIVGGSLEVGLGSMGQSIGWAIGSMSQSIDHIIYSYDNAVNALSNANSQLAQNNVDLQNALNQANQTNMQQAGGGNRDTSAYWERQHDLEMQKKRQKGFATGGLTTRTGLAWLDGTPSEPEYVLNARQTDAFLKLAEVLPSMLNGTSTTTNNIGGNMYLEFHVNVDNISDDYDVDQLVERVKDDIYNAASYRNANVINFSR